jgi:hypothetical protein
MADEENKKALIKSPQSGLVGADLKLSHCADSKMSQGWKPTLKGVAVDKCSYLFAVVSSLAASAAGNGGLRPHLDLPQT